MKRVKKAADERAPLQLGVVGFGKLGLLQAALANALPGCRLVALADSASPTLSVLQQWRPEIHCFPTHSDMLRGPRIDAAIIATPTHLHIPIATDFVAAGIPVFIEKPLSISSEQARPLVELLRKSSVNVMIGYMNRFSDTFRTAHEIIQKGTLGRLQTFRGTMYISQCMGRGKGWRYDGSKSGGGVLITQNSHLLDLLLWTFGDIEWVSGHAKQLYSKSVEDAVHCYLSFESGLTGWIDTSWSERHHRVLTTQIDVQGERGTLHFNDDEVRLFLDKKTKLYPSGWTVLKKPDLFQGVSFDVGGPHYTRQLEQFIRAVRGEDKVESDVHSAYRVQCIVDAIYQSARENGHPTKPQG